MNTLLIMLSRGVPALMFLLVIIVPTTSQNRDIRSERIIIDDNGEDGAMNTMSLQTTDSLGRDVILTIPDMGMDSAQIMLMPPGAACPDPSGKDQTRE